MKKSINMKIILSILALSLVMPFLFAGCGKTNQNKSNETPGTFLKGTVTISGSTSVQPLAQILADEFTKDNPGISIDVQAGGSSAGIKNASTQLTDIGNSSRELKEEEKEWKLDEHKVAIDGIAVIVHPDNSISDLSKAQIISIYKGEITNWKDVGGEDKEIVVVSREEGSGTRGAFEEILKIEGSVRKDMLISNENGIVKATVASKKDAIGYMSLGYVDGTVKAVKVDGIEASVENIKADKYAISRPFLMLTKGELRPEVKEFLDYIKGEKGQEIVAEEGYITIN